MRFSTLSAFSLATAGVHAASGFASSCRMDSSIYSFVAFTISTQCKGSDGQYKSTTFDVTKCYNVQKSGQISCGAGDLSVCTCANNPNGVGVMSCLCPTDSGTSTGQQQIDLNKCIGNNNGKLFC
ncbi:hypothetical protein MCOR25_010612 [Pyricularia grisea]|uniref:Cyanovirin-N domain-containing protein n=1 Tax=Pyricularia grisea TaxID=148305 RepID=A0A6P8AQT1_PYRGI|nr:uncharacterized protein PgNI_11985 [Pyricularia grisea]KAI6350065.1 hypothetical protein MCOR25_010612 [Pyricularia grisea]TLD04430.1 hypothetical protein PgNI_11985 [Pyricularia grisea]